MFSSRRGAVLAASATALLLALSTTACGTGGEEGEAGKVRVRIAYQAIPNADLVVKNQRLLEKALPDAEVSWVKFDSGGDVNTAVIAGAGHDLNLHIQAPQTYDVVLGWIDQWVGSNPRVAPPSVCQP